MKKVVLVLLVMVGLLSCKQHNAWTKAYETKTYNDVYSGIGSVVKDSAQRKQLAAYMIKRYKALLPYGLESVSSDSLKKISSKIGDDYLKNYKTDNLQAVLQWDTETEASLRKSILKQQYLTKFDLKSRVNFCNCFIAQLKTLYPDSLVTPIPDSSYNKVINACIYTIKNK